MEAFDENREPTTEYRLTVQLLPESGCEAKKSSRRTVELGVQAGVRNYRGEVAAALPQPNDQVMQPALLVVTAWRGDEKVATAETPLQLLKHSDEWIDPQAQPENLAPLVQTSGGNRLTSASELGDLFTTFELAPGETLVHNVPWWHSAWLYGLLVSLLALEWSLRRLRPSFN